MIENLHTFLHDHLAGADLPSELLQRLSREQRDEVTRNLAADVLVEVIEDRDALRNFADSVQSGPNAAKGMAAWMSDKALSLKLRFESADNFGSFQAMEFLVLVCWANCIFGAPCKPEHRRRPIKAVSTYVF